MKLILSVVMCSILLIGFAVGQDTKPTISNELKESIQLRYNRRQVIAYQFRDLEAEYHKKTEQLNDEYTKLGKELTDKIDEAFKSAGVDKAKFEFDMEKGEFVAKKDDTVIKGVK